MQNEDFGAIAIVFAIAAAAIVAPALLVLFMIKGATKPKEPAAEPDPIEPQKPEPQLDIFGNEMTNDETVKNNSRIRFIKPAKHDQKKEQEIQDQYDKYVMEIPESYWVKHHADKMKKEKVRRFSFIPRFDQKKADKKRASSGDDAAFLENLGLAPVKE